MNMDYQSLVTDDNNSMQKTGLPCRKRSLDYEIVVAGGGMAGICAAVAAARHGARTVLVQDRPVLGGNASSEIRVCVNGAKSTVSGTRRTERETGIIEEILLENRFFNPQDSYSVWDHLLYDFVSREENLDVMLNTQVTDAITEGNRIKAVVCWQMSTETEITIGARQFIDCSGDGLMAAAAGAPYRAGREASHEFDEKFAAAEADGWQMGASLLLKTRDMGRPMKYDPPSFAIEVDKEYLRRRRIGNLAEGYWWIELGSDDDIIAAQEENRHKLMGFLHGVWDYIKNSGEHPEAAHLVLEWVGSVPGRRESRRFVGDHILSERDVVDRNLFEDAVCYGGWPIDEHCPGGILSPDQPPTYFHHHFDKVYQIPFRCLYSCRIENLMFSGRNASTTHIALSTTRVIKTGAVMGQAAGTAAAMCVRRGIDPREVGQKHIGPLQQELLRDDAYIPLVRASGEGDLARQARMSASSTSSGNVELLVDGVSRDEDGECHHWESDGLPATVNLEWDDPVRILEVVLKLHTDLWTRLWKPMKQKPAGSHVVDPVPPQLMKSLELQALADGDWVTVAAADDIHKRLQSLKIDAINTTALRVVFEQTHGHPNAKVFEVRCY